MTQKQHRFYTDLAPWWPLISPAEEYAEEAAFIARLLDSATLNIYEVLELGSGGGHNAVHLKKAYHMTLVDLSAEMLAISKALNPECEHHIGDMRSTQLNHLFDAVLIHDAIDYMLTEADLESTLDTAFTHCRPGGCVILMPDHTTETYQPSTEHGGHDAPAGHGIRYLEWSWDPDPHDSWIQTDYTFVCRSAENTITTYHESHQTGLFSPKTWLRLLAKAGFQAHLVMEETTGDHTPRQIFVGYKDPGTQNGKKAA